MAKKHKLRGGDAAQYEMAILAGRMEQHTNAHRPEVGLVAALAVALTITKNNHIKSKKLTRGIEKAFDGAVDVVMAMPN